MRLTAMGPHRTGDQAYASDQQDEHQESIEEAGGPKVNLHVGNHARQDEERAGDGKQPADPASTVKEQNSHAKEQRDERDAETVCPPEAPVRPGDGDLVGKQVSSN